MTQSPNRFTNRADLLIAAGESIKMQTAAGIEPLCKFVSIVDRIKTLDFTGSPQEYEFPLAVIEGKPVFVGDELYDEAGDKHTAPWVIDEFYKTKAQMTFPVNHCWSWNPPKSKTIMVPLLREDAESLQDWIVAQDAAQERVMNSIREALEK